MVGKNGQIILGVTLTVLGFIFIRYRQKLLREKPENMSNIELKVSQRLQKTKIKKMHNVNKMAVNNPMLAQANDRLTKLENEIKKRENVRIKNPYSEPM